MIQLMCWLYARLLWLYPPAFREQFGLEMQQVCAQVIADAAQRGPGTLFAVCVRELSSVLVGSMAARAQAIRVAIWGGHTPPEAFTLATTLRRLLLLLSGLAGLSLLSIVIVNTLLDIVVPQTATAPIERVLIR